MCDKEAIEIFENITKRSVIQIKRCSVGIANYVFIVVTKTDKVVLRCSETENAYQESVYYLSKLSLCDIPIPVVLSQGKYKNYFYLILSYIPGNDIVNVYSQLSDNEKKQIAKEVIEIQRKVSQVDISPDPHWTWNGMVSEVLDRAEERIKQKRYFDVTKVHKVKDLRQEMQGYLNGILPIPYLDDISTKNLLIRNGRLSGIIDVDWMGFGDILTFAAMTKVALLNMDFDTKYVDFLLEEIHPDRTQYKAFVFYCLMYCVDFMGERGMEFLDKTIPVNESIVKKLNDIFDTLWKEWERCAIL